MWNKPYQSFWTGSNFQHGPITLIVFPFYLTWTHLKSVKSSTNIYMALEDKCHFVITMLQRQKMILTVLEVLNFPMGSELFKSFLQNMEHS